MTAIVAFLASFMPQKSVQHTRKYGLPLPPTLHVTLGPEVVEGKAVFVIGDIHGCYDELCELIHRATDVEPNIVIVCVGDLINNGPHSANVLKHVQGLGCHVVCGNHEEVALREVTNIKWNDGYQLPDKYHWILSLDPSDVQFIESLPYSISIPSLNAIIVHAGLVPGILLEQQHTNTLAHVRNIIEEDYFDGDGLVPCNKPDHGVAWSTLWPGPQHVYYGHDARRGFQNNAHATCLDTGCLYGGFLTGMFINKSKQIIQVKAKQIYSVGKPE
ncbi:bis(5'-nucleosyl)-tetraphosphatase PrpE [asymmetrical]-like isoform X2 [Gigantopelta aegis]|uniref:bis(5'-nucleosyl)-tetraphosphatase PrpE [asymmetrical]-like isoform X2 n=1 Tax=Gigantopelta aegis TaxID=1735272 RepID=UPI001B888C89|nr:bis(5'-nucleosyl)-tetraphosphatase PrpE [asymmetrical]-like isoform X2 [Gigantopelta aegis]XP_041348243.1 bis(5'-nucleosyl)-tetraphosphatase PrpE [asymmetrical]-like isoform X2 [Gigantopelta aegis]